MEDDIAIGIDLGTTNTCVAAYVNGEVVIIPGDEDNVTPSLVAFDQKFIIGADAKQISKIDPQNVVHASKRLMGQKYADVQYTLGDLSYSVIEKDKMPFIRVTYRGKPHEYRPEQIAAIILQHVKKHAQEFLKRKVTRAVIGVPAHFGDSQRRATKEACEIAGLQYLDIYNEPTLAAIAYKHEKNDIQTPGTKNVLVYDLGGGTFDASVVETDGDKYFVKSFMGLDGVGGENIDERLVEYLVMQFQKKHNEDPRGDLRAMKRLRITCEEIKKQLSVVNEYIDEITCFFGEKNLEIDITKEEFEKINDALFKKTIDTLNSALKKAKKQAADIDEVVIVGGSSRIPKIQQLLADLFGMDKLRKNLNPEEAIARGAAIMAASKTGKLSSKLQAIDVVPASLGVDDHQGRMQILIYKNTPVPAVKSRTFYTTVDDQPHLDIGIYEGDGKMACDNKLLGNVTFENLPKGPKFSVEFMYTLSVNSDGILSVSVVEKSTGKQMEAKIQYGT